MNTFRSNKFDDAVIPGQAGHLYLSKTDGLFKVIDLRIHQGQPLSRFRIAFCSNTIIHLLSWGEKVIFLGEYRNTLHRLLKVFPFVINISDLDLIELHRTPSFDRGGVGNLIN
jgi:hypothetical protein